MTSSLSNSSKNCPDDSEWVKLADGFADEKTKATLLRHGEHCEICRQAAALFLTCIETPEPTKGDASSHQHATRVNQYSLVKPLGRGASGIVYLAYDTVLERFVALKLLNGHSRQGHALLEARSMARVSHPHVVQVYEIGTSGVTSFVAMQYIPGVTLREWQTQPGRRANEIVKAYLECAQGLAAAHELGVIHCDFKPENVLVDRHGVCRVVDFGLAQVETARAVRQKVGTPKYMAPEVHRGERPTVQSDQYSYARAFEEALQPFSKARWPFGLSSVLTRARASEPKLRFSSLDELLAQVLQSRTRLKTALGLALSLLVLTLIAAWPPSRTKTCSNTAQASLNLWSLDTRAKAQKAFIESGVQNAAANWQHLDRLLSNFAPRWSRERMDACVQADVIATGARLVCLDEQLARFRIVASVANTGTKAAVSQLHVIASQLGWPEQCRSAPESLEVLALPNTAHAEPALQISQKLSMLEVALGLGQIDEAQRLAKEAVDNARTNHLAYLEADALLWRAKIEVQQRQSDRATAFARESILISEANHFDALAARAWLVILDTFAERMNPANASPALASAQAAFQRSPKSDALTIAWLQSEAKFAMLAGRFGDAVTAQQRALGMMPSSEEPMHIQQVALLEGIGLAKVFSHEYAGADAAYEKACRWREQLLGVHHIDLSHCLARWGVVHLAWGNIQKAQTILLRAKALLLESTTRPHTSVVEVHGYLSRAYLEAGDDNLALFHAREAVRIGDELTPVGHPVRAMTRFMLGWCHTTRKEGALALKSLVEAEEILNSQPKAARTQMTIESILQMHARALNQLGRYRESERVTLKRLASLSPVLTATNLLSDAYVELGISHKGQLRLGEAKKDFIQAHDLAKGQAHQALAFAEASYYLSLFSPTQSERQKDARRLLERFRFRGRRILENLPLRP